MRSTILCGVGLQARWLIAIVVTQTALSSPGFAGSQLEELAVRAGFKILSQGSSTADVQQRAKAGLPLNAMTAENRQRALKVIENCNQFRRLPQLQYAADPAIYTYLLQHPDVAVSTWRVMGISRFEMWQTGPMEYEAQATDGSEGLADVLLRDDNNCIFICDGSYNNPLLPKPLQAAAVVWFRHKFSPGPNGAPLVTQEADVFVSFPSQGLSTVAKVLTPVTNAMMDRNVFEVSLYASLMSRAVRNEPEWVIQVAEQMEGVLPQRTAELVSIARQRRVQGSVSRISQSRDIVIAGRNSLLPPDVSLFEPPRPEELAAVPGDPALPVPPGPANTDPVTATSSSASASTTSEMRISPGTRPGGAERNSPQGLPVPAASTGSGLNLQDSVLPPVAAPRTSRSAASTTSSSAPLKR